MNYLKLFTKHVDNLKKLLQTVKNFSNDIEMKFGFYNCLKATFEKERLIKLTSIKSDRMMKELK